MRTKVKICGLTRAQDVEICLQEGADAIGFVLYQKSPRFVSLERLKCLTRNLPPFVTPVLLFVNATREQVLGALEIVPHALLQFHGDETPSECTQYSRPYIRAARIQKEFDLHEYARDFTSASALLLDTYSTEYGGTGKTFDWSCIPKHLPVRIILSGGLNVTNVADGIKKMNPWAVDVSSGVEVSKGVKDPAQIKVFMRSVREADMQRLSAPDFTL